MIALVVGANSASVLKLPSVRGQQGGPASVFYTDVPKHDLDLILARPTATSITMSLLAYKDLDATVTYGPDGAARVVPLRQGAPSEVEVTNLAPNQSYQYTVASAGTTLASGTFRTARPAGEEFVFAMQADSHLDNNTDPKVYANTLANMTADKPDFMIDLGDTFMTDKYPVYQNSEAQYLAQRYYFGLIGQTAPVFLTLGNHDGEAGWPTRGGDMTAWSSAMRRKYFPPVQPNEFYTGGPENKNYHAWTWGDALFVVLDPYSDTTTKPGRSRDGWAWTLGREQYDWLKTTLEGSSARFTFVFIHHLVGGNGKESRGGAEASVYFEWGGANTDGTPSFAANRPGWPMPIHDLLVKHGVSAVFHGHDHLYVHQERDGIAYQEVPQPSFAREGTTGSAAEYGYKSGTILGSSGHLRVTVSPTEAVVDYVKSRLKGPNREIADHYVLKPNADR